MTKYHSDLEVNSKTQAQIRELIGSLGISAEAFCICIGVETSDLKGDIGDTTARRLQTVNEIFDGVGDWFDSPTEVWEWFTSQPLIGFNGKTPAEVVRLSGVEGMEALKQFVKSKELGGFE